MQSVGHYINNQHVTGQGNRYGKLFNPATGQQHGQVDLAGPDDVEQVLAAAHAALPQWSARTPLNRARVLFRFKALIEANLDELARMITREHGKVFSDARAELQRGLEVVEFACGIPHLLKGEHSLNAGTGVDSFSLRQPVGVCVGITPFNFPAMVPLWMYPVALACGNTFVLKPSELDPSVSLRLAELLTEAGAPAGVFNVLNGDQLTVQGLLDDNRVQAVSFVGSTPVAEAVYQHASRRGIRAQALGGAKNHMLLMPDADLKQASSALMGAAYGSAGERCMAISVAVCVGDATADALIRTLSDAIAEMSIGPGLGDGDEPHMGPLVSEAHAAKVRGFIDIGVQEGARLVCDGRKFVCAGHEQGFFVGPTLFDRVTPNMRLYREEIFGPVLCVVRVPSYEAGLALVNQHDFGNGTAIFTRDGGIARRFCEEVDCGMVGVNVPIPVPMAFHSFGGWKRSLFGPLHIHGPDGIRFYTRLKTVTARWPESAGRTAAEFVMPTLV
ncbi:MAG: CoA-acylating methylmalonate-semialdehyde dehydrogenase [Gammaproteobacteria bacterium]|nr:CoA-acylating methylmalonate-semialdehyde dehydrogenase [Gammaproteobacteria bacterium]